MTVFDVAGYLICISHRQHNIPFTSESSTAINV